jgi:hypothetical protein
MNRINAHLEYVTEQLVELIINATAQSISSWLAVTHVTTKRPPLRN